LAPATPQDKDLASPAKTPKRKLSFGNCGEQVKESKCRKDDDDDDEYDSSERKTDTTSDASSRTLLTRAAKSRSSSTSTPSSTPASSKGRSRPQLTASQEELVQKYARSFLDLEAGVDGGGNDASEDEGDDFDDSFIVQDSAVPSLATLDPAFDEVSNCSCFVGVSFGAPTIISFHVLLIALSYPNMLYNGSSNCILLVRLLAF
jgi:hypothetical protein